MEVLAGVIVGLLIALALGKKPIDIHINTTHEIKRTNEEVRPILPEMESLSDAMHKADPKEDEVYKNIGNEILSEINKVFGGEN